MVQFRDFGSPVDSDEPVVFMLYGQRFSCVPAMQGTDLIEIIGGAVSENPAENTRAILDFFKRVLRPEDRERFDAMTHSEGTIVPMDTLSDIMGWLTEVYTGRPTEPPVPSPSGDVITGPTPVAVPSPPPVPASALSVG